MSKRVLAVFGGQYGSEGKGVVVASMAHEYKIHVRVGGPNAGHSFSHNGTVYKMQSVPCGWINPNAILVIGRGALISLDQLQREMHMIEAVDPTIWNRVMVDSKAGVIDPGWHNEGHTDGELHQRIGSTGEGIGAARVARTMRDPHNFYTFGEAVERMPEFEDLRRLSSDDTAYWLTRQIKGGTYVLLEGTQGAGLSLLHGPWPYVTSTDVGVAQMCADIGIAPSRVGRRLMVVRTHPIRVAGNSGPLRGELSWDDITAVMGRPTVERTTVTQKVRRIGSWDEQLVQEAVYRNDPTSIAIMFLDYLSPVDEGKTKFSELSARSSGFIRYVESAYDTPVSIVGTGGNTWKTIRITATP